jgi:acyl carrier protein
MLKNGAKMPVIYHHWKMTELILHAFIGLNSNKIKNMGKFTTDEMKDIVLQYVIKEYLDEEDEEITNDTALISSGYVDSFSMVSLLVFIENKFKVKIPPSKATPEAFDSVNKIVALVNQYIQ